MAPPWQEEGSCDLCTLDNVGMVIGAAEYVVVAREAQGCGDVGDLCSAHRIALSGRI